MEQYNKRIETIIKIIEIATIALVLAYVFFFIFPFLFGAELAAVVILIFAIITIVIPFFLPCVLVILCILKFIYRTNVSYEDKRSVIGLKVISGIFYIASLVFFIITTLRVGVVRVGFSLTSFLAAVLWFVGIIIAMMAQIYFLNKKDEAFDNNQKNILEKTEYDK